MGREKETRAVTRKTYVRRRRAQRLAPLPAGRRYDAAGRNALRPYDAPRSDKGLKPLVKEPTPQAAL
jgi:hypothetical protein